MSKTVVTDTWWEAAEFTVSFLVLFDIYIYIYIYIYTYIK
jgi:hypothetical protein